MFGFFKSKPKAERDAAGPVQPSAVGQTEVQGVEHILRRLEWTVIRRLDGLLQGDYRTLLRGTGIDLADLREYQHHDDVRHIDWNVTARLQTPHVRVFTEDREMTAWFLLDLSLSIDFGSGDQLKHTVSSGFVAVLARLLTRHGNRVGAILYGTGADRVIPAGSGRRHVLQLMHAMTQRSKPAESGTTRLADLLSSAASMMRRRSTVFVVSDFISEPGWEKPLGLLAQKHEVVAVRLFDRTTRHVQLTATGQVFAEQALLLRAQLPADVHSVSGEALSAMFGSAQGASPGSDAAFRQLMQVCAANGWDQLDHSALVKSLEVMAAHEVAKA